MASKPARARLLWVIPYLVLPVTFGHTTACRSPALAFSAAIHFAMQRPAPCSIVLRHFPSSWAAVVHWSALISKVLRSSRKHRIHSFSWPPKQPAPATNSPDIRTSAVSRPPCAPQSREQGSASRAQSPRCTLTSRLDKRVQIGNRVVGAIVLSPTDAASQEAAVGSAQRLVVAHARARRDASRTALFLVSRLFSIRILSSRPA